MTPLRVTLALVAVLLAAGCAGWNEGGSGGDREISSMTLFPGTLTPIPNQTRQAHPSLYWIKIDPIGDKHVGDVFTITATTNISAGEEILIQVTYSTFFPGSKIREGEFYGLSRTVNVIQGNEDTNSILFGVNTSPFTPDEYVVTEFAVIQDAYATEKFRVFPQDGVLAIKQLKPKNFVNWKKLHLPTLEVNTSILPVAPSNEINLDSCGFLSQQPDPICGGIMLFSEDGIVRIFDKNGKQIAAYYDFKSLHSITIPKGSFEYDEGNVTTVYLLGWRIFTVIAEAGY